MKTMTMMKSMALATMMMITTAAGAVNNVYPHHGAGAVVTQGHKPSNDCLRMKECNCRQCQKARKTLDKHMRKHHQGKQNRMACRTCMELSRQLHNHSQAMCNQHHHNHR